MRVPILILGNPNTVLVYQVPFLTLVYYSLRSKIVVHVPNFGDIIKAH